VFLVVKGFEYHHKWVHHLIPGEGFHIEGTTDPAAQTFFVLYFCMTGLHALHMIVGLGLLAFLVPKALRGEFSAENHNWVEGVGLYWHFVDIIWIFLFPLLYLLGRHHA
jgi:cytochrome c oxidase subunit 3